MENEKIGKNPAARIARSREDNRRVRFLPGEEESSLRGAIAKRTPQHVPAFDLSLHSGMRASEQFSLKWLQIELAPPHLDFATNQEREVAPHSPERGRYGGAADPERAAPEAKPAFSLGISERRRRAAAVSPRLV